MSHDNISSKISKRCVLIAGSSNKPLARLISKKLKFRETLNIEDDEKTVIRKFSNTEYDVSYGDAIINNKYAFILQTGSIVGNESVNDMFMQLVMLVNACKLSTPKKIIVIIPNFPYARSDKMCSNNSCIGAQAVCSILSNLGVDQIISFDLHSGQIQGFLQNKPFTNIYATKILMKEVKKLHNPDIDNYILVAPDQGAVKRIRDCSKILEIPYVEFYKRRNYVETNTIDDVQILGDHSIKNKICIIVDDIIDTMGTMIAVIDDLCKYDVNGVIIVATHGILSGQAITRINDCNMIKQVIITNTIDQTLNIERCNRIKLADISSCIVKQIIQQIS